MKTLSILLTFLLWSSIVQAQTLEIDLGALEPGDPKVISENRNVKYNAVLLKNKLPRTQYSVWIEREMMLIEPLEVDWPKYSRTDNLDKCESLVSYLDSLKEIKFSENEVSKIIESLENEIEKCKQSIDDFKDRSEYGQLISDAEKYLESFQIEIPIELEVNTGEIVRVYVKRDDLLWTIILKGEQPGKWVTTYGFGFTSQRLESDTYFTKQDSDLTIYQISKAKTPSNLDLNCVPAVFFSYFPSQRFGKWLNHSLSAGLGFDLSAPVVFFGYNMMYHHNIGITAGVSFQQQLKLKDQYSLDDTITITLDKDQLHDKVYRPNIFISINFRFGENPFRNAQSTNDE